MTTTPRVLMAGGGSAGHTSPLIATAEALRRLRPEISITALGTERGLETRVIPEAGLPLELVPAVPLPRTLNADLFATPSRVWSALRATLEVIDRIRSAPDADSRHQAFVLLEDLCTTMEKGSLCAMGSMTPNPVLSALDHFPEDFA